MTIIYLQILVAELGVILRATKNDLEASRKYPGSLKKMVSKLCLQNLRHSTVM